MNPLKKLASQTAIYGLPSIGGRFVNYLLMYLLTRVFTPAEFGVNTELYSYSGFFTILLAFGLETGYFRYRNYGGDPLKVYSTAFRFVTGFALTFCALGLVFSRQIAAAMKYEAHAEYIQWFVLILALDAISAIPFARLRAENKPVRFAVIKIIEIGINVGLTLFFLVFARNMYYNHPEYPVQFYSPAVGVGLVFLANLIASGAKVLLLSPQIIDARYGFDRDLFKQMLQYSLPLVVIGFAGIINEMLDRMLLKYLLPYDDNTNLAMLGIYGACYKLSILMTLFIQAFRFAAEPFFFAHAEKSDSRKIYADVLNYFSIFCVFIFLMVMLFINQFAGFIGKDFRVGLAVVPVLMVANLCLGIYTNLTIWYKLTDKTYLGAMVAIGGAALTIVLNVLWIPRMGYMGAAWATLACYAAMAIVSYLLGQKYFPVPYNMGKVLAYIAAGVALWQLKVFIDAQLPDGSKVISIAISALLLAVFAAVAFAVERKELLRVIALK